MPPFDPAEVYFGDTHFMSVGTVTGSLEKLRKNWIGHRQRCLNDILANHGILGSGLWWIPGELDKVIGLAYWENKDAFRALRADKKAWDALVQDLQNTWPSCSRWDPTGLNLGTFPKGLVLLEGDDLPEGVVIPTEQD